MRTQRSPRSSNAKRLALAGLLVVGLVLACGDDAEETEASPDPIHPSGDLVGVAAPARGQAIVASADGRLFRTTDGGASWSRGRTPPVSALAAVEMADTTHGWAVGPGTLLRTEDGGARWERQRLPGRADDWPLHAVAAIDAQRAVVLASEGRWLATTDGGGLWRAPRPELDPDVPAPGALAAIDCASQPLPRCWAVGDGVVAIDPATDVLASRSIADPAGLPAFRFRAGGVDLTREDAERVQVAAETLSRFPVAWQVEAFVAPEEIRLYAEDQDPSALFDRIEARTRELAGRLEAAGVDASAIEIFGAPPWGYEDFLDDDPGVLERYWSERLAAVPSATAKARESVSLRSVVVTAAGLVAGDDRGRIFVGDGEVGPIRVVAQPGSHALLAIARTRDAVVAVGRQGQAFRGGPYVDDWRFEPVSSATTGFDALRDVALEPDGQTGWRVGDDGHVTRTQDGGRTWSGPLGKWPSQADRLPLR